EAAVEEEAGLAHSHQLLDAAGQAFLGLLDLDHEAALLRAARLALDLGAMRRLAAADVRDGLAEVAQREEARRDARAGTALEQVGAGEGEAALLAALELDVAQAHPAVGADVVVQLGRVVLARELAPHLLEDLV